MFEFTCQITMRQITASFSLLTLFLSLIDPASAGERQGVPGRRVGGGTRFTQPKVKQSPSRQARLAAMSFASRANLPISLKLKAIYG
jgi:hypothetical protein